MAVPVGGTTVHERVHVLDTRLHEAVWVCEGPALDFACVGVL